MSEINLQNAHSIMYEIRKQYPVDAICTWSPGKCCGRPVRGGGDCAQCLTAELGQLIGAGSIAEGYRAACEAGEGIEDAMFSVEQAINYDAGVA